MEWLLYVDALFKGIAGFGIVGILWGVWKIASHVTSVQQRVEHMDEQVTAHGAMIQQNTTAIGKIEGFMQGVFGKK
jgi:hypothetical protein